MCAARINARLRRAWWLLVPLAFLLTVPLPILPAVDSVGSQSIGLPGTVSSSVGMAMHPIEQVTASTPARWPREWWILVIALSGSTFYLLNILARTHIALRCFGGLPLCTEPSLLLVLEECRTEAGVVSHVGLVVSKCVRAPLVLGWLRPRILLPSTLAASLSREQLRAVLFHELAHVRARDVPCTFLFTLICALHWFNPAAYLALRWWTQFREEAADEAAITLLGASSNLAYGETLLHVLRRANQPPAAPYMALAVVESVHQLKKRLTMIKQYNQRSTHRLFTTFVFVAAATGILLRPVRGQNQTPLSGKPSPTATAEQVSSPPPTVVADDKQAMVDQFKKKGYTIPESLIDERVATIVREEFKGDQAAFRQMLQAQGFSEASFRNAERDKIVVQAMRFQLLKEAQEAKAQAISLPQIKVRDLRLSDAVELLTAEVHRLNPQVQGMSVRLDPQAPQAFKDAKVTLDLTNVSLLDVVRAVAQQTGGKVGADRQGLGIQAKASNEDNSGTPGGMPPAPLKHTEITVNVLGAVNKPARATLPADATILDALAAGGGATTGGNLKRVKLIHRSTTGKVVVDTINVKSILDGAASAMAIQDGDTINVPSRDIVF